MNKSILYLLFIFSLASFAQSNKLYQKTYTKQDGIEMDRIYTLCYDNDGFLWLGGSNYDDRTIIISEKKLALQRFNGNSFHSINLPDFENAIEQVQQLYKRKDGKFYVSTKLTKGYGLLLFDPFTSKYETLNFGGLDFNLDGLSKIFSYKNEDYLLIQKGTKVSIKKLAIDLSSTQLFSFTVIENKVLIDSSSRLLFFKDFIMISDDNFNVKVFDWNGELLKELDLINTYNLTKDSKTVIDEAFVKEGVTYLFLNKNPNLYKIDEALKNLIPVKNISLPNKHLNTYNDSLGNVIIFASNNDALTFNSYSSNQFEQNYLINFEDINGITVLSKNLTKDVWLSTNGKLHYYKFPNKSIKNYLPDLEFRTIKPIDSINYLVASEMNGWFKINPSKDKIETFPLTLNNKPFKSIGSRNFIFENNILWSHGDGGIIKVNIKNKTLKSFKHFPVICMEKINDSIIVYGTKRYRLMQFNTQTKVHSSLVNTDSLYLFDIQYKKHSNLIVAGTDKGLLTYNLETKAHTLYNNNNNNKTDLEDPYILMLDYHKDYGYLLGTRTGHIVAFNAKKESFTTIFKDDLKAGIATILFDKELWWINTFNGYIAFNPKTKSKIRFSEKDGFSHYEANRYSALKTKDGFFVGTLKGLNYFKPSELKTENDSASLTLLKINQFNNAEETFKNTYDRSVFSKNTDITLPSENRRLEVGFGLKNTDAVYKGYNYRYRLNNKGWIALKDQNEIQFPNLAAGNYTLEIEALNFSGKKIANALIINIYSTEFFYKKWWFFTIISLSIISFLLWLLQQAKNRKRRQEEFSQGLIKSQEDERKRIARELHDSISQQLTLIKRKAQNTNQEEIKVLTHNTLEEVRAISYGLYPPLLKQLGLSKSIEQLILEVDEQTNLFISGEVDKIDTYFNEDQTLNCYRFIQECVNNCLKHGDAKALSISVLKTNDYIKISIQDNGKGFDVTRAKKQNSLGLKTIYERIRILKGELTIESKPNQGTLTTAKIPLKNG
ncbi:sensor histidine kinase [Lacinutrix jangbogonensis]|uniref:sensor histidine kinase n=1 Tax=Lacinutrix jangbogonensis TaxID=1469557 RepID=UPI00053E83A5|nr:ATP-binding protein [Lacinutrix jangbogonensis]